MKTTFSRRGRPPSPAAERRSDLVKLRATVDEAARIDELAAALDVTRSEAVRLAVDEMLARLARREEAQRTGSRKGVREPRR